MEKLKLMWIEFWADHFEYYNRRFWTLVDEYEATIPGSNEQELKKARKLLRKMGAMIQAERFCMKMLGEY